jgi:hypothetical protein
MSQAEHASPFAGVAEPRIPAGHRYRRIPNIALAVGVTGAVASAGLALMDPRQFYFSYLVAFLYFLSFALGGLFFTIVQFAARAGWSVVVRRIAETLMATAAVFVPLFIPVVAGLLTHHLYHWAETGAEHDAVLRHKAGYLNIPFFLFRAVVFLGAWTLVGRWYYLRSTEQDTSGDQRLTRRMQNFSGPALVIFAFTITYAAVDWIMSLTPHWYSTIYGAYYFAGSLVAIFASTSLIALALSGAGLTGNLINAEHFHDLGKLLFAFLVFWTYLAFSQYMLIWYGNLPEETVWFRPRWGGGWQYATVLLAVGHFIFPFFFLMSRHIKRSRIALTVGASWMLFIHLLDIHWLVMPTLHPKDFQLHLVDFTTLAAVGGFFVFAAARLMLDHPLIPLRDPRLPESIGFENA